MENHHPHVRLDPILGHVVRGTKLPVRRLFFWHQRGIAFEQLRARYPKLNPAQILDALSFAHDCPEEIAQEVAQDRRRGR